MLENALDYVRMALYAAVVALGIFLFQAWQKDHPQQEAPPVAKETELAVERNVPATKPVTPGAPALTSAAKPASGPIVHVKTDVMEVDIDTRGGDIIATRLLKYPESLGSKTPFLLFNDDPKTHYIAESGLLGKGGPDTTKEKALYTTSATEYMLEKNASELTVNLHWQNAQGIKVTKSFIFHQDNYEVDVQYTINNQSAQTWTGNLFTQLVRANNPAADHSGLANLATYFGAAISSPQKPFEKVSFKDMQEKNVDEVITGGWAAMVQHYFVSAWIPEKTEAARYYSHVTPNGLYTIGMVSPELSVPANGKVVTQAKLYAGPAVAEYLEKAAPGLQLTIDYGWFWFISVIIFWMMDKIYKLIGNWGWSIVLVTVIIKLLFYHLSAKSYRSMSSLKNLQPRIELLKERYGDDKQKFTQATLDLYRQEKVNPMSGCLPILVQIPVFIALYWVLIESVELRQAPFILWIKDLTQHDPYYVLPVLMGISMFLQQRLNPPPPDPLQAKIMMLMPVVFTVLFVNFPAGLMLYWFANNMLSFLQQWYIMHKLGKEEKVAKPAR